LIINKLRLTIEPVQTIVNRNSEIANLMMARGWESKSVEQQIEDARTDPDRSISISSSPAGIELRQRREGLRLQRSRILQELDTALSPRYQALLKEMLLHIESQISSQ
jgi:hypothetical protein